MEPLGEDEIFCIYERINDRKDKKSFSIVCKKFLKVACFHLRSLYTKSPDLLLDILITSPKMFRFECYEPFSNNHMKLIADSCPNIKHLNLSVWYYLDHEMDKLEFDDVGLCAIANGCIHLDHVDLSGRLRFKEIGIGSLVRSCKNLRYLTLEKCLNVTDKSLKVIGEATSLKKLDLDGCCLITDLGLKYLANGNLKFSLIKLVLNNCNTITDSGIIHLKKLVSLRTLGLSRCGANVTDQGVGALCDLPNLNWLYLEGCKRITSVGLHAFYGHQTLRTLRLVSCYQLSFEVVKPIFMSCPNIRRVYLSRSMEKPLPKGHYEYFNTNTHRCRVYWE